MYLWEPKKCSSTIPSVGLPLKCWVCAQSPLGVRFSHRVPGSTPRETGGQATAPGPSRPPVLSGHSLSGLLSPSFLPNAVFKTVSVHGS
uniref:Uncharacterized protein n=1 Tax=Knipowitschia caucasica TaxID=637954 RepID=A0AAV2KXX5_KNICA